MATSSSSVSQSRGDTTSTTTTAAGTSRSLDSPSSQSPSPDKFPLRPRWFYAREGDWVVFSQSDDEQLEARFQEVGGEEWFLKRMRERKQDEEEQGSQKEEEEQKTQTQRKEAIRAQQEEAEKRQVRKEAALAGVDFKAGWFGAVSSWWSPTSGGADKGKGKSGEDADGDGDDDGEPQMVEEILDPDESDQDRQFKVPVLEDKLFDVDLEKMQLYPVFFKGVLLPVVRATWFYWSELREEYSPISWASDMGQDLSKAWNESEAWRISTDRDSKKAGKKTDDDDGTDANADTDNSSAPLIDIRSGEAQNSHEKAKVQFKSPITGSVFSGDVRGRVVSLVGGFTVIRGFDEVEKRTQDAQRGGSTRSLFDMPDLPWASNKNQDYTDNEAANQAQLNSAVKSTRRTGAAQPDNKSSPPAGGGGYGSNAKKGSTGDADGADAEDNQGFAASLWPSSDSWLRPRFAFLKSLGFTSDDATEEAKRTQKQKNTEQAAEPESEGKKSRKTAGLDASGDDQGGEEEEDQEQDTFASPDSNDDDDLESRKDDPVHLILVIHGIGQGIRDTFESLDFTWDVQKIRNLSRATAQDEGIRMLSKGRRVQYIPICWRRDLDFSYKSEENDNQFGLADVTNDATIPFVRNIVSKVILDVPYYLSEIHKPKMVQAVKYELNRVYRLFIRRNPDFLEKDGKVSIIGHSLGSCLAADILSEQPTHVPSIKQLSHEEIQEAMTRRLLFNTTHLFLVGSPLGLFLHLGGGQLIARKDESRAQLGEHASHDVQGKFGCLAFSGNLFNCYNSADPVAYRLNGTVDQKYATLIRPVPLPGAVNAMLDFLKQPRLVISKLFDPVHPFASADKVRKVVHEHEREHDIDHHGAGRDADANGDGNVETDHHSDEATKALNALAMHEKKSKQEEADLKRYGETRDGAVKSLASRAARTANQLTSKADSQDGGNREGARDEAGSETGAGTGAASGTGSGALSPVRLEQGSSAKQSLPFALVAAHARALKKSQQSSADDADEGGAPSTQLDGLLRHLQRAERRFRALNKHGCIDYFFEDSGSISEYFSMLGAHNGYWTSASFVSLVLSQVFDDNAEPRAARLVPTVEKPTGGLSSSSSRSSKKAPPHVEHEESEDGDETETSEESDAEDEQEG